VIDSMNPSAQARSPIVWVDLGTISPGQRKTLFWPLARVPIFVVHRTPERIETVRADDNALMRFPEPDRDRVLRGEWLVVIPRCRNERTSWGQEPGEPRGEWGGWQCDYGDAYDLSGRLRNRWGESNFEVPPYRFVDDRWLVIGERP
jgi:ubiquinol-cytochrome c reductase iron-sulfur subunit